MVSDILPSSTLFDQQVYSEQQLNLECLACTCILEDFASGMKEIESDCLDCCHVREFTSDNLKALSVHIETTHMNETPKVLHHKIFHCDICNFTDTTFFGANFFLTKNVLNLTYY